MIERWFALCMGILRWYAEAFLQQGALQKLHKHGYHSALRLPQPATKGEVEVCRKKKQ